MLIFVFNRLIGGAIIYCIFEIAATVKAKDYYAATESVVSFLLSASFSRAICDGRLLGCLQLGLVLRTDPLEDRRFTVFRCGGIGLCWNRFLNREGA